MFISNTQCREVTELVDNHKKNICLISTVPQFVFTDEGKLSRGVFIIPISSSFYKINGCCVSVVGFSFFPLCEFEFWAIRPWSFIFFPDPPCPVPVSGSSQFRDVIRQSRNKRVLFFWLEFLWYHCSYRTPSPPSSNTFFEKLMP